MKSSKKLIEFIKGKEKFMPEVYDDATGKAPVDGKFIGTPSIGFGDTAGDMSKPITETEAYRRKLARLAIADQELNKVITRKDLSQNKWDVLADMHYNMGLGELTSTGLIDLVNAGKDDEVLKHLPNYTKAYNKVTKQMEVQPGLVTRAQERATMYADTSMDAPEEAATPVMQPVSFDINNEQSLASAIEDFDKSEEQHQEVSTDRDLEKNIREFQATESGATREHGLANDLKTASDVADPEDNRKIQEAKNIAKETGIPYDIAMGMMTQGYKPNEIRAKAKIGDLARNFPASAKWAKDPANFAAMQETGDWAKEIEAATNNLKSDSNLSRAYDTGLLGIGESATALGVMLGTVGADEAEERFLAIDDEKQRRAVKSEDVDQLRAKWDGYIKKGGSIWDVIAYTAERPAALGLQTIESGITSSIPFAFSLTGILAPATLPYAVGGAFLSGGAIAAGGKFRESLDNYIDPKTNKPGTMRQALNDKDFMSRARKEASIYGGVMGTFDAAFGLVAGKFFPRLASKGLAGKVVGTVAEVASGPVSEGASETVATSAADVYKGTLTTDKWEQNKRAGLVEGAMSVPLEGGFGPIAHVANKAAPIAKIKALKTVQMASDGVKALKDTAAVSQLRAKVEKFKGQFPDQARDLVNQVFATDNTPQPIDPSTENAFDNFEEKSESDIPAMNQEADSGVVHIAPSEWIAHFEAKGLDPLTMMQYFGQDVHESFLRNIDGDVSVAIPTADWIMLAETDTELDLIARFEGNKYNANEATVLMDAMDANPRLLFRDEEIPDMPESEDSPPPTPDEEPVTTTLADVPMTIIEATQAEGNSILRPVDLVGKFNNDEEKTVFGGLKRKLQKVGKELKLEKDAVEAFADVQFGRLKHRADVTGRSIEDIYNNTTIAIYDKADHKGMGYFSTNRLIGDKTKLAFNRGVINHIDVVLHEFGHSWLHEMAEDYHYVKALKPENMTDAQAEYSFAMDQAAELFGIKNVQELLNLPNEQYTKLHEAFAQTTELYFLQGKYANNKIKAVMETFRRWIVDTLHYIKRMASRYPTFQLTPEVERMFEGILGTSAKIEETVIPMFTAQAYPDSFLGVDAQKFKDALADVQSEAIGETYLKAFKRPMKERETIIRNEMERITKEANADVDVLQSMQFLKVMGNLHKEFKEGKIATDPRLSYESIQSELLGGSEADVAWLKGVLPAEVMTGKKRGGVDVRDFMHQNGLTNPAIVLDLLIQTSKRQELVDARIKEKIKNEFPVTKTDEEIHEIAVEAVNGKAKEFYLMLELKKLASHHLTTYKNMASKLMQPPTSMNKISKEDIQHEATAMILDANVVKFSPDKYLRDSQRMARKSSEAFRKNDIVDAFNYKRREAVLFMAYREAQAAQRELAIARNLSRLIIKYAPSREAMRRLDTDVMKYAYSAVDAIRNGQAIPRLTDVSFSKYSGMTAAHALKIEEARMELVDVMQSRVGKNMSIEGGLAYASLLKALLFVAKRSKETEIAGKKMLIREAAESFTADVDLQGPVVSYEKDWWFSASRRRVSNHKVATGLASLYPDQTAYAQSVPGSLMGSIRDGEAKVGLEVADAERRLYAAFKKIVKNGPKKSTKESVLAPLKRLAKTQPIAAPEINFSFRNEGDMLMAIATTLGSESGALRFLTSINPLNGQPISSINIETGVLDRSGFDAFVARMIQEKKLTKEHFELFQTMWDIFEEQHPGVRDVMRDTDGFEMGYIEPSAFSNEFGDFTGGYVPVAEDRGIDDAMVKAGLLSVDSNGMKATNLYPTMSTGITKKRNKLSSAPLDLDMRKVLSYVSAASKIRHLRKPMMSFGTIMKRADVAAHMELRRPDFLKNVVTPWFDYVVDQVYTDPDKNIVQTVFGKLRKNANTVMYLGGLMTPVRQFYGLLPSAQRVGGHNLRRSLVKMSSPTQIRAVMDNARNKSVFMQERADGSLKKFVKSHDVLEINFDWWSTMGDWRDKLTYVLTQATQNAVDAATWDASYYSGIAEGLDEKSAVRLADSAVADTQGSPNVSDMSMIQRGSNFERLITMVTSVPLAMNNMIAEEMMRTPEGKEKLKIAVAMGTVLMALPFILESGLDMATDDDDEKDVEDNLKTFAAKAAAGFLDVGFPVVSRPLTGYLTFNNPSVSPALSKLTNAARLPEVMSNAAQGVDMTAEEVSLALETFTLFTSIPTSVGGRAIKFVDKQTTSKGEKKGQTRRRRRQLRVVRRSR